MKKNLASQWQTTLPDHVLALTWSPGGEMLAAAQVNGPITIFSATGQTNCTWAGHHFGTMALAWRPSADRSVPQQLASSGQDGKIRLWQVGDENPRLELAGGSAWVEHLAWSADGAYLASAAGRKIRIWDSAGQLCQEYTHPRSTVAGLGWRPLLKGDPRPPVLAVIGYGGLNLYTPGESTCIEENPWKGSSLVLSWSPDGRFIATGDQDSTIHFWFADTGQNLQMWGYPVKVMQLAWDASSRYLATGGSESVVVWDCFGKGPEGTKPAMLQSHQDLITCLAFKPAGELLASGGRDGKLMLWREMKSKKHPWLMADLKESVSQLAWSPDGKFLAAGTEAGGVFVFDMK